MSVRVYLEKNLTPELVEESMPLIKALHLEGEGTELKALNVAFLRDAVAADMARVVLARDGEKLVGFMMAVQTTSLTNEKQLLIHQTYVMPEYRARGRSPAVAMIELLKTFAAGAGAVLYVVTKGEVGPKFYIAMGAEPVELVMRFK